MNIHQKINVKGNKSAIPSHFTKNRKALEWHSDSIQRFRTLPRRIMACRYQWPGSSLLELSMHRIHYEQDRKTNHREPKDSYWL